MLESENPEKWPEKKSGTNSERVPKLETTDWNNSDNLAKKVSRTTARTSSAKLGGNSARLGGRNNTRAKLAQTGWKTFAKLWPLTNPKRWPESAKLARERRDPTMRIFMRTRWRKLASSSLGVSFSSYLVFSRFFFAKGINEV